MAERKAVNKYYPPEWTPSKGSINKFRGSHPLRDRARKLDQGILIIRFEMPYNIWCEGCGNHIGMGVRYNAEKSKVGMYYTTPIYKFRMKCHLCTNHFEIQTDPQNLDYVILSGAKRQERRWDAKENEQVTPEDKDVSKKLATDAMFRLEHGVEDKEKKKALAPNLTHLEELQERWKDDYTLNRALRDKFRVKKKELQLMAENDKALLMRSSLSIPLLPETPEDAKLAGLLQLTTVESFEDRQKQKREEIESRPLFQGSGSSTTTQQTPKNIHTKTKDAIAETKAKIARSALQHRMQAMGKSLSSQDLGIVSRKADKQANKSTAKEPENDRSEAEQNSKGTHTTISLVSCDYLSTDSEEESS